jgi:hypothetical protein
MTMVLPMAQAIILPTCSTITLKLILGAINETSFLGYVFFGVIWFNTGHNFRPLSLVSDMRFLLMFLVLFFLTSIVLEVIK